MQRCLPGTAAVILGAVLTAGAVAAYLIPRLARRAGRRGPPVPASGLSRVDLPPLLYTEVDGLRAFKKAGSDRFEGEAAVETIEKRLALLIPFLRSPPRDAEDLKNRFPEIGEAVAEDATISPLAPAREKALHRGAGAEAHAGEPGVAPPSSYGRGPLALAREAALLIRPLETLESASLKVTRIGALPPAAARSPVAEVHYQLAGEGADGKRRQWNGRLEVGWTSGFRIASLRSLEAIRVALDRRPFKDASAALLGGSLAYREQLRPGLDFFRDRLDAATGIDVYGHHGIAVGDIDGDGREDFYLPEPPGLPALAYLNRGDGTFLALGRDPEGATGGGAGSEPGGSGSEGILDGASQALLLDLDNDADQDLFLVGENGVTVLKNDGRGGFTPLPGALAGLESARATTICAAAADYDQDGAVDVYVGSYVFWRGASNAVGSRLPFPYHDARNGAPNFLLRNRGDGTFQDVTGASGLAEGNDRFTFAAAWGDYDDDGYPDLAVANDFGKKNLFHNQKNGTFVEVTAAASAEDLGAGMSAAWEDYDNDGRLDLYFGNMFSTAGLRVTTWEGFKPGSGLRDDYQKHARGNTLLRNRGDGTFEDVSLAARAHMGRWAWSSDFLDFDLDGREDIYIANGFVTNPDSHDL